MFTTAELESVSVEIRFRADSEAEMPEKKNTHVSATQWHQSTMVMNIKIPNFDNDSSLSVISTFDPGLIHNVMRSYETSITCCYSLGPSKMAPLLLSATGPLDLPGEHSSIDL